MKKCLELKEIEREEAIIDILLGWLLLIILGHFIYGLTNYIPKIKVKDSVVENQSKAIFYYISIFYFILFVGLIYELAGNQIISKPISVGLGSYFFDCGIVTLYFDTKVGT